MGNKYKEVAIYQLNRQGSVVFTHFSVVFVGNNIVNDKVYFSSTSIYETYQKAFEAVQLLRSYEIANS